MDLTFQRRTDLALAALRTLNGREDALSGPQIAAVIGTTTNFLPHVMSGLVGAGFVSSARGPGGGYRLTEAGLDASVLDVVEVFEGEGPSRCVLRDAPCPGTQSCLVHPVWAEAREALVAGFGAIPAVTPKGMVK